VEEALIEIYLAGVSVHRVEDITEALWGTRVSPSTVSDLDDLRDDRGMAQPSDRGRAPVCLSRRHRAQARLGRRGAQRLAAGCDRCERARLSGDSRHLRGGEGGQDWLERVPQASQGTRIEGYPADHLGCLHWACRKRRGVLSRGCLAKVRRGVVEEVAFTSTLRSDRPCHGPHVKTGTPS